MFRQSRNRDRQSHLKNDDEKEKREENGNEDTHEEIVCLWTKATDSEKLHHIEELTMDVATYLDGW